MEHKQCHQCAANFPYNVMIGDEHMAGRKALYLIGDFPPMEDVNPGEIVYIENFVVMGEMIDGRVFCRGCMKVKGE